MSTGLRRSTRVRKPTARSLPQPSSVQTTNRVHRALVPKTALDGFMIKVYAEIHAAALTPISQAERSEIHGVLRKARTVRFLKFLPKKTRDEVTTALKDASPSTRRVSGVHRDAMDIIQVSPSTLRDRLHHFPNLLLLSICAHSETFRTALAQEAAVSKANHEPTWAHLLAKLKQSASSLELFAQTRGLGWRRALAAHDNDFDILLSRVLRDFRLSGIDKTSFGIGTNDLQELHAVDDTSPYHWVLPPNNKKTVRCEIEYKVTADLMRDGVAVQTGNNTNNASPPTLQINDDQVVQQWDIADSIILPNYTWPKLAPEAAGEPRFCGFKDSHCVACGQDLTCTCTPADLLDGGAEVLVELITTARTGTGVRALQDIRADQYLGEYVGEIYPARFSRGGALVTRYGGASGHSYILEVPIARASDYVVSAATSSKRRRKRTNPGVSSAATGAKKTTTTATKAKSKTKSRVPGLLIDSTVRGNWTRYINHSCKPNTQFAIVNVGQQRTVLFQALRSINYGDEITVDYGDEYFLHFDWGCKCGHARCRYWREGVGVRPDRVTLKMALSQKIAPKWAEDDDDVPIE
ncbi:hypothetical protein A1O1_08371 [Capronia coronata CBS 617.96]|uniref:SET domain-containing protein n=1 Tax=Capronia coronata CBS 617.96 TaxID=1182541 RepID=W9YD21_9EURO|nr:uncharacterized protein A1O1_08371 [Capronia coronata CBS 617.96]EXJ80229.1 hypothetical protein A1O1_08371 [Capronia coronata CBS 617.96]